MQVYNNYVKILPWQPYPVNYRLVCTGPRTKVITIIEIYIINMSAKIGGQICTT